jgi:hypothetical protein
LRVRPPVVEPVLELVPTVTGPTVVVVGSVGRGTGAVTVVEVEVVVVVDVTLTGRGSGVVRVGTVGSGAGSEGALTQTPPQVGVGVGVDWAGWVGVVVSLPPVLVPPVPPEPPDPEPLATGALGTGTPETGELGEGLAVMEPTPEPAWVNPPETGEKAVAGRPAVAAESEEWEEWWAAGADRSFAVVAPTACAPAGFTVK